MKRVNEEIDPVDESIDLTGAVWSRPGESLKETLLRATAARRMVRLDPDVAEIFPDAESVNTALRELAKARA